MIRIFFKKNYEWIPERLLIGFNLPSHHAFLFAISILPNVSQTINLELLMTVRIRVCQTKSQKCVLSNSAHAFYTVVVNKHQLFQHPNAALSSFYELNLSVHLLTRISQP